MSSVKNYINSAFEQAELAWSSGEVPIGAVCVKDGEIISRAHNLVETNKDASAHAEILAMKDAAKVLGDWRLEGVSLYVTLEPCTMCVGAMILARVEELHFGAYDLRQGAVGSLFDLSNHSSLPHSLKVFPAIDADRCGVLLKQYFSKLRDA